MQAVRLQCKYHRKGKGVYKKGPKFELTRHSLYPSLVATSLREVATSFHVLEITD